MPRLLRHACAILLLLAGALAFIVAPPSADAASSCDLVTDPFVAREAGFSPFFRRDTVSASELLLFAGSLDAAVTDANRILRITGLPDTVRTFYDQALVWFSFVAAGECADAVVYPGPFENSPSTAGAPYGFTLNPVGSSSAPSFSSDAPAPAAAISVPTSATLAHTGSETNTLLYFGVGLVGFGAVALGSKRRYL